MNTITRRIQHDHIRLFRQVIQNFQNIACNETAIIQPVQLCIFSCSFHCILYDFYSDHLFCHRRKKLCDRTGTTVKVKYLHTAGILNVFSYNIIKYFRRQGIRLEERKGTDSEFQSEQRLVEIVLSIKNSCLIALHDI